MARKRKRPTDEIPTKSLVDGISVVEQTQKSSWAEMFRDYWEKHEKEQIKIKAETISTNLQTLQDTVNLVLTSDIDSDKEDAIYADDSRIVEKLDRVFDPKEHLPTFNPEKDLPIPSLESKKFYEGAEIGPFRVGKKIGEGGMGAVYLIMKNQKYEEYVKKDGDLKSFQKILKIPLRLGAQKLALENEIRVLKYVRDKIDEKKERGELKTEPNIIKLHNFSEGMLTYVILELLEGFMQGSKENKTKKHGTRKFTPQKKEIIKKPMDGQQSVRVARYIYDVAKSLDFLHSINVVHGDIKYHNCMDTHRASRLEMIIFDFGVAKILTEENKEDIRKIDTLNLTPLYITRDFLKEVTVKYPKKDGKTNFYNQCPLSKMRTILKKADWDALAFSAYHLLTGVAPYSFTDQPLVNDKYVCVVDTDRTKHPFIEIARFKNDPIDYDIVKQCQYGDIFVKIFDMLRDTSIVFPESRRKLYGILKRSIKQPGLFD